MSLDLGDVVALTATARDASGAAANAGGVVLTITLPDGSTASPEVVNPPAKTGEYEVAYPTSQPGLHAVRWVFTDPASAHTDVFNVLPAIPRQIMSLADAKQVLKKKTGVNDDELRSVIAAATGIIEHRIGPVLRTVRRERHAAGGSAVALHESPVLEVLSVTHVRGGGPAVALADVDVDVDTGVLRGLPATDLVIEYAAGRRVIDQSILEAAGIIIDHLWATRRGHSARPGMFGQQPESPVNEEQAIAYYAGFALPHRAAELLAPFDRADGFA